VILAGDDAADGAAFAAGEKQTDKRRKRKRIGSRTTERG
jgi:hypothetical protein